MAENSIKGIVMNNIALTPASLAFAEKLEKFDCVIVLDELGNDARSKAELCIYDAMSRKNELNILIVTTEKLMYSWYSKLVSRLGVDFKFITAAEKGISFFSPSMSNLYIMSEKALLESNKLPVMVDIERSEIVWDLVIIDGGLPKKGFDAQLYTDKFKNKAEKLVMLVPCLKNGKDEFKKLLLIPEALLNNEEKAAEVKKCAADSSVLDFSLDTVFMKYYELKAYENAAPKLTEIKYAMGAQVLKSQDDLVKMPLYDYGGNVFEELTLEQRRLYISTRYNEDIIKSLCAADRKLEAFLKKLEEITADEKNTAVIYFSSDKTLEYIVKVLATIYTDFSRRVSIRKTGVYDTKGTLEKFSCGESSKTGIILTLDGLDECFDDYEKITHIISYEYPSSPEVLQHRYRRLGRSTEASPEFIVFTDEKKRFDGRMLTKVVALNILSCFKYGLPSKNVFLYIPSLPEIMTSLACDLLEADAAVNDAHFSGCMKKFNSDYNQKLTSFTEFKSFVGARLAELKTAFEFSGKEDKNTLSIIFTSKLEQLRKGFSYLDENGVLKTYQTSIKENPNYISLCAKIKKNEYTEQLSAARTILKERFGKNKEYVFIQDLLTDLSPDLRASVLFNIWRYAADECGIEKPYSEFIRLVNEGVI